MSRSGDRHGGQRAGSGRSSSASPSPSRLSYSCPVCGSSKRSDKLKAHLLQLVHFNNEGKPVSIYDSIYKTLSREAKEHTDYCRTKEITKMSLETFWKRLSPSEAEMYSNPFLAAKRKKPTESICKVRQLNNRNNNINH